MSKKIKVAAILIILGCLSSCSSAPSNEQHNDFSAISVTSSESNDNITELFKAVSFINADTSEDSISGHIIDVYENGITLFFLTDNGSVYEYITDADNEYNVITIATNTGLNSLAKVEYSSGYEGEPAHAVIWSKSGDVFLLWDNKNELQHIYGIDSFLGVCSDVVIYRMDTGKTCGYYTNYEYDGITAQYTDSTGTGRYIIPFSGFDENFEITDVDNSILLSGSSLYTLNIDPTQVMYEDMNWNTQFNNAVKPIEMENELPNISHLFGSIGLSSHYYLLSADNTLYCYDTIYGTRTGEITPNLGDGVLNVYGIRTDGNGSIIEKSDGYYMIKDGSLIKIESLEDYKPETWLTIRESGKEHICFLSDGVIYKFKN